MFPRKKSNAMKSVDLDGHSLSLKITTIIGSVSHDYSKPLTIITKRSILDVAAALDPPPKKEKPKYLTVTAQSSPYCWAFEKRLVYHN